MSEASKKALLPAGLRDVLSPDAAYEAAVVEKTVTAFTAHGYERVKPPLIEFETSLLSGSGAATAKQAFRLMDPISQKMMGLRPDLTVQVGRIATTRLANQPRPLRLSYAGQVLRVKGTQLRPERQYGQVGAEMIGSASAEGDAEIILMAAEALMDLGVENLSIDLGIPTLITAIKEGLTLQDDDEARLDLALERKDVAEVAAVGGAAAETLVKLIDCCGSAKHAVKPLENLSVSKKARAEIDSLLAVIDLVRSAAPNLSLTVDPVERRGYEYHTGVTFTFFALDVRGELGRGGRYMAGAQSNEPATGVSLFTDSILRALPAPQQLDRIFLPYGTSRENGAKLRSQGWVTVNALEPGQDEANAKDQNCTHIFSDGEIRPVTS